MIHESCKLDTKDWVRLMDPWFKINSSWQTVYHIRYMNNHIPLTLTYLGWSQNVLWFGSFPRLFIIIVLPRLIQKTDLEIWISKFSKSWLTIFKNPDFQFLIQFQTKRKWFWVRVELFDSPATWYNWAAKNNHISSNPNPDSSPESILELKLELTLCQDFHHLTNEIFLSVSQ